MKERHDELVDLIVTEVGKTAADARVEVGRAIDTFALAAEEAVRRQCDGGPADFSSRNKDWLAFEGRYPIGVVSMIVPFNFPLNLAAHKIAPAIAVGCPFVLKPSEKTPASTAVLGEMLAKTSLPDGAASILPCDHEDASAFSEDERIAFLSFTGSAKVGWQLKSKARKAKVALELGGNAACIVDQCVDVEHVAGRLAAGAFGGNGQSCISVQRILIHAAVYDDVVAALIRHAQTFKLGDPRKEGVKIGPLITDSDAERLDKWVGEAVNAGANALIGGKRDGAFFRTRFPLVRYKYLRSCSSYGARGCALHVQSGVRGGLRSAVHSRQGIQYARGRTAG